MPPVESSPHLITPGSSVPASPIVTGPLVDCAGVLTLPPQAESVRTSDVRSTTAPCMARRCGKATRKPRDACMMCLPSRMKTDDTGFRAEWGEAVDDLHTMNYDHA